MQEENKQLKCEVKSLQESTEFQNETYEKMKNDMKEEKQKLEADYRNNLNSEKYQNKTANCRIRRQTPKKKFTIYGHLGEIWSRKLNMEESKTKVKVFLPEKTGLETEEITIDRAYRIGKKREGKRMENFV